MPRRMFALAFLATAVLAQEKADLLDSVVGRLERGKPDAPAVSIRLQDGGLLQAKVGEEWKDATLDDCAALLKKSAEEYDAEMRKSGKSGYEDVAKAKASRLFVSIEADPTAPWKLIQWILTVAAEQKFYKFELADGKRRLLAFLPNGVAAGPPVKEPPPEIKVGVHVVVRSEKPGKWAGLTVLRPVEVRYKYELMESSLPAAMGEFMKKAKEAAKDTPNARVRSQVRAGNKVPLENVLDLMDLFVDNGIPDVSFFAGRMPEARGAVVLPYPEKNYDTVN